MAEYCKECFMKMDAGDTPADHIILSNAPELCEGCGKWRRVVVDIRPRTILDDLRDAILNRRHPPRK